MLLDEAVSRLLVAVGYDEDKMVDDDDPVADADEEEAVAAAAVMFAFE